MGLNDLDNKRYDTVEALLVLMYSPRLSFNGIEMPECKENKSGLSENMKLYRLLELQGEDAHSKYNSLQRRIVSFCSTLEHLPQKH